MPRTSYLRRTVEASVADSAPPRPSYVNFFPSDWRGGTAIMSPVEEWTYLQICLHNWDKGEAVPKRLQAALLARNPEWEATVAALVEMDKVTVTASGAFMVPRALASYRAAAHALEKKSNSGRKGARSRWTGEGQPPAEPEAKPKAAAPPSPPSPVGDLIFNLDGELWRDFRKHRVRLGAPMTDRAERSILKRLEEFQRKHGNDPEAVVEQSIRKGWRDVFPLKGDDDGNGPYRNGGGNLFDGWTSSD